ncbi:MAG: PKD domain-containing protein [Crocinitomicaceae bacterium]
MKLVSSLVILSLFALVISCKKVKEPIPCIETDKSSVSAGDSITFTSCSENELSYIWEITGPDSSTENGLMWNDRVFTRAMSVPGTYKVKLIVFNNFSFLGDSASDSTTVVVN